MKKLLKVVELVFRSEDFSHLTLKLEDMRWKSIYNDYRRKYNIHSDFRFNGPGIVLTGDGKIFLDEQSYIGSYSRVQSAHGKTLSVGKGCRISHFVALYTMNHDPDQDFSKPDKLAGGDIAIGDYCYIGIGAYIGGGVSIGDNTVIGAHSIVTKNLPPHCIAVGIPAKIIQFKSYVNEDVVIDMVSKYKTVLSESLLNKYISEP